MPIKGHTPYIIDLFGIVGNNYAKCGGFVMNLVRILLKIIGLTLTWNATVEVRSYFI